MVCPLLLFKNLAANKLCGLECDVLNNILCILLMGCIDAFLDFINFSPGTTHRVILLH